MVKNSGQSLIEILIALTVFAIVVSAVAVVFWGASSLTDSSGVSSLAMDRARTGLEAVRTIRDGGWSNLSDGTYGLQFTGTKWEFIPEKDVDDIYTRKIVISSVDYDTKLIEVNVSWKDEITGERNVKMSQTLSRWQDVASENQLSGDWTRPRVVSSIDIGSGGEATGLAYQDGKIYLSSDASSSSKPDIFIIDVNNPLIPQLLGSLNIETGLAAIAVIGKYAYVVEADSSDFFVVDVSSPSTPSLTAKLTLPGSGKGRAVASLGKYVLVGLEKNSEEEFVIVDASNPASPFITGSLEIDSDVNAISFSGNTAFLASDKEELYIIDISNKSSPAVISQYDALGNSESGLSIQAKSGGKIYLGRAKGGNHNNHHEFFVINSNPLTSPTFIGSRDIPSDINGLAIVSHLAMLATSDSTKEFQILNLSNLPIISQYATLNLPQKATGIVFRSNYAYLSMRSNDALKIISSSP